VQKQAAAGVNSLDDLGNIKDSATDESPEAKARREQREREQAEKSRLDAFYVPNDKDEKFPVVARVENGAGEKVEEDVPGVPTVEEGAAQQPAGETPAANEQPTNGLPTGGIPAAAMP
jgi:hypothetical protein